MYAVLLLLFTLSVTLLGCSPEDVIYLETSYLSSKRDFFFHGSLKLREKAEYIHNKQNNGRVLLVQYIELPPPYVNYLGVACTPINNVTSVRVMSAEKLSLPY